MSMHNDNKNIENLLKWLLLLLSIWPTIYFLVFGQTVAMNAIQRSEINLLFLGIHLVHLALMIGIFIFYVIHLSKNEEIDGSKKTLWTISLFLFGPIGMMLYWF